MQTTPGLMTVKLKKKNRLRMKPLDVEETEEEMIMEVKDSKTFDI